MHHLVKSPRTLPHHIGVSTNAPHEAANFKTTIELLKQVETHFKQVSVSRVSSAQSIKQLHSIHYTIYTSDIIRQKERENKTCQGGRTAPP